MTERRKTPDQRAREFLSLSSQFRLGTLMTEARHPDSEGLAELTRTEPARALDVLQRIDLGALRRTLAAAPQAEELAAEIAATLKDGGRIFLCGCGATGRLSLILEYLWRGLHPDSDSVISFMAGGDVALIRSVENFEDHPEFGAVQLGELGFTYNDLLISCTEGGETPFVIGATELAARMSRRKPWFLYCNPDEALKAAAERSRRVIENPAIRKISCAVGPMALSGSTRLQATTTLTLLVGLALLEGPDRVASRAREFLALVERTDYGALAPFAEIEADVYAGGGHALYETDHYGITILTDTTERSPTFSLRPFENRNDPKPVPSLASLLLPHAATARDGWRDLLRREPRALDWPDWEGWVDIDRLRGYDFSRKGAEFRAGLVGKARQVRFRITDSREGILFGLEGRNHAFAHGEATELFRHLLLKLLLNAHSLLVMGRIGRFESNVMTWVRASNNKLIDRAIRYVEHLVAQGGGRGTYDEIARELFRQMEEAAPDESLVLRTTRALLARS